MKKSDLACGKVLTENIDVSHLFYTKVELYMEHNHFHLRKFRCVANSTSSERLMWDVFDNYGEAITAYKKEVSR